MADHAQYPPQADESEPRHERLSLVVSLAICAGLASFCFLLRFIFRDFKLEIASEVALHVGIAFVVSATIIGVIEMRAHRIAARETKRFRYQVSRDVFGALMGRLVPGEVVDEINDVLHFNFVRRNAKYRIIFQRPDKGMPAGYFIIRREVSYVVQNLVPHPITFTARSTHSEDLDLAAAGWNNRNFHLKLLVNNQTVPLEEGTNLFRTKTSMVLKQDISLDPRESKAITLYGEEPSLISAGRNTYLQASPVIGIEVDILNQYPEGVGEAEVQMNHPGTEATQQYGPGRCALSRAFLPGQGFQVIWKPAEPAAEAAGSVEPSAAREG